MKLEKIVLGTGNPGKVKEWTRLLPNLVEIVSVSELEDFGGPTEEADTFIENAKQKARFYAKKTGEHVFSEDGGYEVDALNGAPGVRSRRILPGEKEGTDEQLIDYILEKVKGVPDEERGVSLTCTAALSSPDGEILFEDRASLRGVITKKRGPVAIKGYPFRTIHFIPEVGKTYAELNKEEHDRYNHKKKIARRLNQFLLEYGQNG